MKTLLLLAFLILEVGVLMISAVAAPEDASIGYWGSVLWLCVLIAVNWAASAWIFTGSATPSEVISESGSSLGVLPGLNLLLFFYSLGSLGTLLLTTAVGIVSWRWQFPLQIGGLAITAVIGMTMFVALKSAQHGSDTQVTKSQLLHELRRIKRASSDGDALKLLDEAVTFVSFHMPHPSNLNSHALAEIFEQIADTRDGSSDQVEAILSSLRRL